MTLDQQQDALKAYWAKRGAAIETWTVDTGVRLSNTETTLKAVRSNLIDGLPPGFALKRCPACAKWTKAGLPIRCSKCDAEGPVRTVLDGES